MSTEPAKRTCLVIGAGGYLGAELADYLQNQGWQVRRTARKPKLPGEVAFHLGDSLPDVSFDSVDAVVLSAYDMTLRSERDISRINIEGSKRVLEQASHAGVKTVLTVSSISAYPGCRSLYGKAKLEIERAALALGGTVIRPGLIHGGWNLGMHGKLLDQASREKPIPLLVGSPCVQYLVHVEDLCRNIEGIISGRIAKPPVPVVIAHPKPWPLRDLLTQMAKDKKPTFIPVPWWFVWSGIKAAETLGLKLGFKSDGVISLVYQDKNPDLSWPAKWGEKLRNYAGENA